MSEGDWKTRGYFFVAHYPPRDALVYIWRRTNSPIRMFVALIADDRSSPPSHPVLRSVLSCSSYDPITQPWKYAVAMHEPKSSTVASLNLGRSNNVDNSSQKRIYVLL